MSLPIYSDLSFINAGIIDARIVDIDLNEDIVGFKVVPVAGQTQNLAEWCNPDGTAKAYITPSCGIVASGASFGGAVVDNIGAPADQQDAARLFDAIHRANLAISGTMPYWEHTVAQAIVGTTSGFILEDNGLLTIPYQLPIQRPCALTHIGQINQHVHGSDPGPWDIQVFKNTDTSSPIATQLVGFSSSSLVNRCTASGLAISPILSPGDRIGIVASGGTNVITGGIVMRVTLGFTLIDDNPIPAAPPI